MVLRPYSEKLNKYFDTKDACLAAEAEFEKKEEKNKKFREEKAEAAKVLSEEKENVRKMYKDASEAYDKYIEHVAEFNKKYREPFRTVEYITTPTSTLNSLLSAFFNF